MHLTSLYCLYVQIWPLFISKLLPENLLPIFWHYSKIPIKCSSADVWYSNSQFPTLEETEASQMLPPLWYFPACLSIL